MSLDESSTNLTFEAAVARLEAVVREMEDGELPLQRMLILFEEGTRLGKRCQELLDLAELRIRQVVEEADGTVRVAAFDVGSSVDGSPAF